MSLQLQLPPKALKPSILANRAVQYPKNLAAELPKEVLQEIFKDMYDSFIFPQLMERRAYEETWDKLLDMYRINVSQSVLRTGKDEQKQIDRLTEIMGNSDRANVSDSLIYDAVDRLKNLNHFISWKDGPPVQYNLSKNFTSSKENELYHPIADKIKSANGVLQWNCDQQDVYRKHLIASGHHYLYGCAFINSEYQYEVRSQMSRNGQQDQIYKCGVTFEPISIRKLWLNYRLHTYDMDKQPCPFFYEVMSRYELFGNGYDPEKNPFGYANLDKLPNPQYLFAAVEVNDWKLAVQSRLNVGKGKMDSTGTAELVRPEFSTEAKWTFYPMLPLDPETGAYKQKGQKLERYIVEVFSSSLITGQIIPIRIQKSFYPGDRLPLYASCHMPDLDSGAYGIAIGEVLMGHYEQICTILNQWIDNKNLINNPPIWSIIGSPADVEEANRPGGHVHTTSSNDFGWKQVFDATQTTVSMLEWIRDRSQTSSKAVDAILGKALGGRTSATEAQNVFQSAMSGVTTDINLFNYDIMGGYAVRVWEITGMFMDEDMVKAISGQYGVPLSLEDLNCNISLKWDVGSTYIESIVKQQHLRYALEAATRSPALRQDILWRQFFTELRLPELAEAVVDNGFAKEVTKATEQAIQTYLDEPVTVNPNQNHQLAIEVKSEFIEDQQSEWNQQYGPQQYSMPSILTGQPITRAQAILEQIQIHQQLALIQMQQQLAIQQQQAQQAQEQQPQPRPGQSQAPVNPPPSERPGQIAQTNG